MDSAAEARFGLIGENLAEILNPNIIKDILAEGRNPRIYWGESKISTRADIGTDHLFFSLFNEAEAGFAARIIVAFFKCSGNGDKDAWRKGLDTVMQ